jgi:hypothetical protein
MVSHFDRHSHYTTDRGSVKLPSPGRHHQNPPNTRPLQPREGWGGSFTGATPWLARSSGVGYNAFYAWLLSRRAIAPMGEFPCRLAPEDGG